MGLLMDFYGQVGSPNISDCDLLARLQGFLNKLFFELRGIIESTNQIDIILALDRNRLGAGLDDDPMEFIVFDFIFREERRIEQ